MDPKFGDMTPIRRDAKAVSVEAEIRVRFLVKRDEMIAAFAGLSIIQKEAELSRLIILLAEKLKPSA